MKNAKWKYVFPVLCSLVIFGVLSIMPFYVSRISFNIYIGVLFCIYFLIPILTFTKSDTKKVRLFKILIILIPGLIVYLIYPIFIWNIRLFPLGLSVLLAGVLGYLLMYKNIILKIAISLVFIVCGKYLYPKYVTEISYQESLVNIPINQKLNFKKDNLNVIEKSERKLVILEFWNSACSQCIKDFPRFQEFYVENKDEYQIYSVNIPWKRDKENSFNPEKFIDSLKFNFPVLSMEYDEAKKLGIKYFPTALIIDKKVIKYNGKLIYKSKGKNDINKIIKKIKNE